MNKSVNQLMVKMAQVTLAIFVKKNISIQDQGAFKSVILTN